MSRPFPQRSLRAYFQCALLLLLLAGMAKPCLAQAEAAKPAKQEFKHKLAADFGTCPDGHKALKDVPIVYGLYLGLFDKKPEELDEEERDLRGKVERGEVVMGGDIRDEYSPKTRVVCSQCGFKYEPSPIPAILPDHAFWTKDDKDPAKFKIPFDARVPGLPRLQPAEGSTHYFQTLTADGKRLDSQGITYLATAKADEVLEAMRGWIKELKGDPSKLTAKSSDPANTWEYQKDDLILSLMRHDAPGPDAGKIEVCLIIESTGETKPAPDQR